MDIMIATDDGHFVSANHNRIAQLIKEYDPKLELVWIPPENRSPRDEKVFAVRHTNSDGKSYIMFHIKESEMDHRVLAKIYEADLTRHDVEAKMDAHNKAVQDLRNRELADRAAERQDLVRAIVGNNKSTFRHNGKVYPT